MGSFPPVGLLGGQFTDLGSYKNCVNLITPIESKQNNLSSSTSSGHASYCTLAFRPIVPKRPHFHMIFHEIDTELIQQFNESDIFNRLAHKAQYFHYLYMRTGICVPSDCSPQDIQQVATIISRRLILAAGPVKCFTRASIKYDNLIEKSPHTESEVKIENKPVLVNINKPMNTKQFVALVIILSFFGIVLLATLWHSADSSVKRFTEFNKHQDYLEPEEKELDNGQAQTHSQVVIENYHKRSYLKQFAFDYLSLITNGQEYLNISMKSNEIKCLHGLRVLTMIWIIMVHTFQYNEWSGFTQVFEIVPTLQNIALHPLYNANYVVDNFFFMSGLLASYTAWYSNSGTSLNFSFKASLVGRYLRLTPQVLLISLFYILLPLVGDSPNWYDITNDAAKHCERNWWVNLLHIQSFYRDDQICNLVGWWISIDMFYYVLATGLIFLILNGQKRKALVLTCLFCTFCIGATAYRHYVGGFTPNNLGVIPQIDEVWTEYVVYFFWSPYPHAFPFFYGLWIGYILANNKWRVKIREWSRAGWTLSTLCLILVNLSSHIWMAGYVEIGEQYISTTYNIICAILWSVSFSWITIACHYGCAPTLNKLLANEVFVLLSKASFIIYLSHMLVIRMYFGLQNNLLEVSVFTLSYAVIGNTFLSGILGIFLCISFESPFMKLQKAIVNKLKYSKTTTKNQLSSIREVHYIENLNTTLNNTIESKVILNISPAGNSILK